MRERTGRLLKEIGPLGADAALLHSPENIRYFTGFTGEGCAFLSEDSAIVLTDSRYTEQAQKQAPGCEILGVVGDAYPAAIAGLCAKGIHSLAYEDGWLPVAQYHSVVAALSGVEMVPLKDLCVRLRAVKNASEIENLRKACEITDRVFEYVLKFIKPGISELEIAEEMRHFMMKQYAAKPSFEFIVAAGENGSMPHAIPSSRAVHLGDMVTLDFGAEWMGYKADMTRTFAIGKPSDKMKEIYAVVFEAQKRGSEALAPGAACKMLDFAARGYIEQKGYSAFFGHGLGHGVGLQIHEKPNLKPISTDVLEPGMAVTVEPGIYLPGEGGVRIEDTCLVTKTGWESLFKSSKELIIL